MRDQRRTWAIKQERWCQKNAARSWKSAVTRIQHAKTVTHAAIIRSPALRTEENERRVAAPHREKLTNKSIAAIAEYGNAESTQW